MNFADRDGVIWLDGELVPWREAKVHVLTHTLHYGMGVFEGVRAYKTESGTAIFRLEEHTDRLFRSAHILGMDMPYDKDTLNEVQRQVVRDNQSVMAGQSGVGKSSLLNAIEPDLRLRVRTVSTESQKGRHTTTTAQLIPLACGGYVVDTPGIRQFALWDVIPEEVPGFYRDLRPYVSHCRYPDCTHTHEDDCAVKDAVADGRIDERRYESYCHLSGSGAG